MKYNSIAGDRLGLVEDTLYNCGLPTVTGSYSAYSLADITRNINNAYQEVGTLIMRAAGAWQFDDSNNTAAPVTYITLGHSSASYTIPTTVFNIEGVEVKDNSGNWEKLVQMDYHDLTISPEEYDSIAGTPRKYDLNGQEIRLYPAPSTASVGTTTAMALRTSRNVTLFTTASTTAVPGYNPAFHKILSYSAAIDFVEDKGAQDRLVAMKTRLEQGLVQFYSKRNVARNSALRTKRRFNRYL